MSHLGARKLNPLMVFWYSHNFAFTFYFAFTIRIHLHIKVPSENVCFVLTFDFLVFFCSFVMRVYLVEIFLQEQWKWHWLREKRVWNLKNDSSTELFLDSDDIRTGTQTFILDRILREKRRGDDRSHLLRLNISRSVIFLPRGWFSRINFFSSIFTNLGKKISLHYFSKNNGDLWDIALSWYSILWNLGFLLLKHNRTCSN